MNTKIVDKKKLLKIRSLLKNKVILCHGTFDLMHTGHIKHLQKAKSLGDILVVSLTADGYVSKGPGRPVFNHHLRAESIAALECVDYVYISHTATALDSINIVRPSLYVKGSDYKNLNDDITENIQKELNLVEKHGGNIYFTDEITFSSSSILNEHFYLFNDESKDYLNKFKSRYSESDIFDLIDSIEKQEILVIGDAIIDEYHYISPQGQTGKGGIMSVQYKNFERFAGGSLALANHVSSFCKNVDLVFGFSNSKTDLNFVKKNLNSNINSIPVFVNDNTLIKQRFLDEDLNRYFEIYKSDEKIDLDDSKTHLILDKLKSLNKKYDLIICSDFGNGFLNEKIRNNLSKYTKFLAVNTQINSGNRGFHTINKYKKCDMIALNEPESRLAVHDKTSPLEIIAKKIINDICLSPHIFITRGIKGVMSYDHKNKIYYTPPLSTTVIDRIGAGDAFLSLTSLVMSLNKDPYLAAFIGSVAAALDLQIVCNKESISKISLKKYISTILK